MATGCLVDFPVDPPTQPPPIITLQGFQVQIVTWVGNGATNRLIATAFPLTSGKVSIFVSGASFTPKFRHNGAMTGTMTVGSTGQSAGMIESFEAAGFRISDSGGIIGTINASGRTYAAVVVRDYSAANNWMRLGTYVGNGTHSCQFTVSSLDPLKQIITNNNFSANDVGSAIISAASPSGTTFYLTSWLSPTSATIAPSWDGNVGTPIAGTVLGDNRRISVGFAPTHVWVFGRGAPYRSVEFTGDSSMALSEEAGKPLTNQIQGFPGTSFEVGDDNNVNNSGTVYAWMAFHFTPADLAFHPGFGSFKVTGSASPIVVPIGFQSFYAVALRQTVSPAPRRRRQPDHTGTQSSSMPGTLDPTAGITALGATTLTLGASVAAAGADVYGYAFGPYDGGDETPPTVPGCEADLPIDPGGGILCAPTFTPSSDSGGGSCQVPGPAPIVRERRRRR